MIYEQRTWFRFNDEETWYSYAFDSWDDRSDEKRYAYLKDDEAVEEKRFEVDIESFVDAVKSGNTGFDYVPKFLFLKERIVWESWGTSRVWNVEDIKKIEGKVTQRKVNMTLGEAEKTLDVEEYFKMLRDNGVNYV